MSKMACRCGAIISDTAVPCPTEGWIRRDQDQDDYFGTVSRDIVAFFAAVDAGQRESWIKGHFSPMYPSDIHNGEVVNDILASHAKRFELSVCECTECGRLHVQRSNGENSYYSYAPDEQGYKGVLRSHSVNSSASNLP